LSDTDKGREVRWRLHKSCLGGTDSGVERQVRLHFLSV
jgi:hypothetical protein